MRNLYSFQERAVRWLRQEANTKCFLALDQGLGKTIIAAVDIRPPALVVCPASLKLNWRDELNRWRPELGVYVVDKPATFDPPKDADVIVINYDILYRVDMKALLPWAHTVILDESHYCKTLTSKRTKAASTLVRASTYARLLSGTPVVNRPIELFPMLKAIEAIKMDWRSFGRRYCSGWETPWGSFDVSGASHLEELYDRLGSYMLRMKKETVMPELPEKTYRLIELDVALPAQEKKFIRENVQTNTHAVPFEALSDVIKLNARRKLPMAFEHIDDVLRHEHKLVIFAWHTEIIEEIRARLSAQDIEVRVITGATSTKRRDEAVKAFQNDSRVRVFIGNIDAAGTGLTLTAARYVIFVETTWTPAKIHQAADRCHRIGQRNSVQVDILTIAQSVDAQQLHKIFDKTEIINSLIREGEVSMNEDLQTLLQRIHDDSARALEIIYEPEQTEISLDQARSRAADLIKQDETFIKKVADILGELGADKLSDLSAKQRVQFIQKLEAL